MKLNALFILFITLSVASSCNESKKGISSNEIQTAKFDSLLTYCNNHGMFNGSIVITKNDTIIFKKSYGLIKKGSSKKIDPETLFYIASVSKQFTAMGIMILQERGQLEYDDPVAKYLTGITSLNKNITIRQLLNHTSGISDRTYYQLQNPNNLDVINALKSLEPTDFGNPNQNFVYSNTGYVLLVSIIEKVSKNIINKFYQDEIFNPLEMTRTFTSQKVFKSDKNKVQPYDIIGETADYESSVIGPGGIYSTINDLTKWNSGLNQHTLVSSKTLQLAFTRGKVKKGDVSFDISNREYGYGFGWMISTEGNSKIVSHDGSTDGYRSLIRKNLSSNIDIILLSNNGGSLAMNEIIDGLNEIFEKSDYQTPQIPIPNMVVNELNTNNIDFVVKKLKARIDENNIPDERILGRLGYVFLNRKMIHKAIGLFKLNLELHPESPDALYVLGEAYISAEQYKFAEEVYTNYLSLKPESKHAIQRLKLIKDNLEKNN